MTDTTTGRRFPCDHWPDASDAELLDELRALSGRIAELETELGIDPSHKTEPDGAYQARARLFAELRERKMSYVQLGAMANMHSETVRAVINKARAAERRAATGANHADA